MQQDLARLQQLDNAFFKNPPRVTRVRQMRCTPIACSVSLISVSCIFPFQATGGESYGDANPPEVGVSPPNETAFHPPSACPMRQPAQ